MHPVPGGTGDSHQPPPGPGQLRNSGHFTPSSVTKMFSHVQKLSLFLYFYIVVHNFKKQITTKK